MFKSQVRPQSSRKVIAQEQRNQHPARTQANQHRTEFANFPQQIFVSSSNLSSLAKLGSLALLSVCVFAGLSGCGGLVYTGNNSLTGSSSTNTAATLSQVSCGTQSLSGPQSKACSVYLSATASGPTVVSLKSSNAALKVPSSVTVSAGAKTTGFNAVSSAVSKSVAVTISASLAGVTKTDVITVYPGAPESSTLSKISCGTQILTGPTTKACSVYLSAATTSAMQVNLSSSSSALQVPAALTVPAGASTGGFTATASALTATQTVTLTATANGVSQTLAIQLEGSSGTPSSTPHKVQLSWNAPSATSDPIVGYKIYRATGTSTNYVSLNSSVDTQTTYTDSSVQGGNTYEYVVRSVDKAGVESSPSNPTTVTIPAG